MERSEIVEKYLQILNLHGRDLDFTFLTDLVRRHVATFAFSSLGCQLGNDLPLDLTSLYQRIVIQRRGGYCFEQNGLLFEILEELGFSPELFLARVIYNKDTHPGLTHRLSLIEYGGEQYVLDVGFGYLGPSLPVPMSGSDTHDGSRTFRIAEPSPGEYHMQVIKDGDYFSLYRFELARYGQADCELGHFYSHRHPEANFVNHLVASLIGEKEIRSLVDLKYWVIEESTTRTCDIRGPKELERILVDDLGIQVTGAESVQLHDKLTARQ